MDVILRLNNIKNLVFLCLCLHFFTNTTLQYACHRRICMQDTLSFLKSKPLAIFGLKWLMFWAIFFPFVFKIYFRSSTSVANRTVNQRGFLYQSPNSAIVNSNYPKLWLSITFLWGYQTKHMYVENRNNIREK